MNGAELAAVISSYRHHFHTEVMLHASIETLLNRLDIGHRREVRLNDKDRPDFMVGRIAIEVKIKGSKSEVITQLHRYAQCEQVDGLVLVTNCARHLGMPATLNGKPLHVASLLGGAF
jgi:hypothetical protein